MSLKNSTNKYGSISKLLHWTIALLFIVQFYLVYWTEYVLPKKSPLAEFYIDGLHKPIGITILCLAIFAVLWRLYNVKPKFPPLMREWEKGAAHSVHLLLYLTMFVMPITGFMMSVAAGYPPNYFGLYQFPMFIEKNKALSNALFEVHEITSYIIIALVLVHTLAALKHHFIDRDSVLKRMLP